MKHKGPASCGERLRIQRLTENGDRLGNLCSTPVKPVTLTTVTKDTSFTMTVCGVRATVYQVLMLSRPAVGTGGSIRI